MSTARGFGINGKSYYSNVAKPIDINLNFVVDSTNGNGLGIRSLKSNGYVENVFMHTSATPGVGLGGFTNPNPAVGYAIIQLKNNFNKYLGGFSGFVSPVISATTPVISGLTVGQAYVITSVGTTTVAEWQAIGFPVGFTPAVGAAFVAKAVGSGGAHTGLVGIPSKSGIISMEVVGDANQTIANSQISNNAGAQLIVQFLGATSSSDTTLIAKAPANESVVGMCIRMDGSSVTVDGL
jgi:hypothetical protein